MTRNVSSRYGCAFFRVVNVQPQAAPVSEIVFDVIRQILNGDDDFRKVVMLEQIEDVSEHWLVDDGDHRFGAADCQGAKP
jgi:hypothetical protein